MPELLSPAGNFEKLKAAVLYGADAVYFAGETFGMRAAADNFDTEQLAKAIKYCHDRGVRAFITVNVMPHEDEYPALKEYFKSLAPLSPDALIIADVGVIDLAKEYVPNAEIHISTQANTMSSAACRCWMKMGAKRIVLARELTFDEIRRIRDNIPPELELEAFIHGSMCVSYSGRCLLSQYYTGRSANDGRCTQPCRWEYRFAEIAEVKRPDDVLTVCETPSGSFTLSSKDMCMIEHIPELIKSGIDSF
ncbi:MAG: U32 family peptidase, partial [Clostridia bacterium]|nr:U32 family peptidase [Clostridia bacterium]